MVVRISKLLDFVTVVFFYDGEFINLWFGFYFNNKLFLEKEKEIN